MLDDVPSGSKKQILIVDDDPDILQMMGLILKKENYIVVMARNGCEGADCLSQETFDLIILDLRMPCMTGQQVLDELARRRSKIPVLVVTAVANPGLTFKSLLGKYKRLDILPKPFMPNELIEKVEKFVQS